VMMSSGLIDVICEISLMERFPLFFDKTSSSSAFQ
jgi:hypothetical protein